MRFFSVKVSAFILCLILFTESSLVSSLDINSFAESSGDNFASASKVVYRAYEQCGQVRFGDVLTCLKLRALKFADRVLRSDSIQVVDGINIVKTLPRAEDRNGRQLNLEPIPEVNEAVLPTDPEEKQDKLNEMLVERMARFFQTHSVQFDMPRIMDEVSENFDDHPVEQGRGKKNRMGLLLLGGMFKSGLLALGLKGLTLLAGKALLVAKIALVLSSIIGLSKLFSSGHGEGKTTYEIVKHPHISHAHTHSSSYGHFDPGSHDYKRSMQTEDAAVYPHLLAYMGQRQGQKA